MLYKRLPDPQKNDAQVQKVFALLQALWHKQYEVLPLFPIPISCPPGMKGLRSQEVPAVYGANFFANCPYLIGCCK